MAAKKLAGKEKVNTFYLLCLSWKVIELRSMSCFSRALDIIKKYEGYSERAYPDPVTGAAPYTFGYGSQYYPDGSAVKKGQCCTKQKALEYLIHDLSIIEEDLGKLNLDLDQPMEECLVSFIHSVGWESFLYSHLIDHIENENWEGVTKELSRWIFDSYHNVIGGLIERRREEALLFLEGIKDAAIVSGDVLLKAFRDYAASARQIKAIRHLEDQINPYVLAAFANEFVLDEYSLEHDSYNARDDRLTSVFDNYT